MSNEQYDNYGLHYARMGNERPSASVRQSRSALLGEFDGYLPDDKDIKVLDCGCGTGNKLHQLSLLGYKNLTGIELLKTQAEIAREELSGMAEIHVADAFEWLPMHRDEYDVIFCYDVLEHIHAEKAIDFARLIRCSLRKGGRAFFRVPNMSAIAAQYSRYIDITHVTGYTEFSLMQLLDIAGFREHKVLNGHMRLKLSLWRPWTPLRGLGGLRELANKFLHLFVFTLRGQRPRPTVFGFNIILCTWA